MMSVKQVKIISGESIDKTECITQISLDQFFELWSSWLLNNIDSSSACLLLYVQKVRIIKQRKDG